MKKKEKYILCSIIILLIIVMIVLCLLIKLKKNNKENNVNSDYDEKLDVVNGEMEGKEGLNTYNQEITDKIYKNDYYIVKYCAEIYQKAIYELLENNNDENKAKLFNMLDEEYINEKNINKDELIDKYKNYKKSNIYIDKMLTAKLADTVNVYIINGKLIDQENSSKKEYELIVKIDLENNTFSIYPYEYVTEKKYNELEKEDIIHLEKIEKIDNKIYNVYEDQSNKYTTVALPYFEKLKVDALYDPEFLYSILDKEYREKRFGSLNNFKNYINENKDKISKIEAKKYARYYYDGYTQYVVIDNNEDYYIFNEISTMNYTILLDDYTIDQPEFIEKYESASDDKKAGYDINKFIKAINAQDYNYAYNCLAESFKQNKFPTLENFEEYVKNNFYEKNKIQYSSVKKEGSYYIYTLNITDANNSTISTSKEFIVNLKDNREFEMSFGA